MTLRVALDKRSVGWPQGTGIRRYRDRLRCGIAQHGELFAPPLLVADTVNPDFATTRVGARFFADAQRYFTVAGRLRSIALNRPVDLAHWSHPMPLWARDVINVVTIHDLIPLNQPEYSSIPTARFRRLLTALAAKGAFFACVSETVRQALLAATGIDPARTICTWQPVDAPQATVPLPEGLVSGRYVLMLGIVEPRKNVVRAIQAWREANTNLKLVIAGPQGNWPDRQECDILVAALDSPGVVRLPWVEDAVAERLIVDSRAVLMPSLAEGFGLPPVEALLAGVPAIASNSPVSREILGDEALFVDARDVRSIAGAIRSIGDAPRRLSTSPAAILDRYRDGAFARRLRLAYDRFLQLGGQN